MVVISAAQWIFLAYASLAFAASLRGARHMLWLGVAAFAFTLTAALWLPSSPPGICLLLSAAAAWRLLHHAPGWPGAVAAGAAAAGAVAAHAAQGLPWWFELAPVLSLAAAAYVLAQTRHRFAPPRLLDQALCGLVIAGPIVAALPTLSEGWRSAQALNRTGVTLQIAAFPRWVGLSVLIACSAGFLHGWWVRR
ncbi:MAG: hypothetical protein QM718_15075 [Steroidobacteraceae bacterium]